MMTACFSINLTGVFQMDKLFTVAGVSKTKAGYKVRFANDIVSRIKILSKCDTDIQLMELPKGMTKPEIVAHLKTTELYANPVYREVIDHADAKYNPVATVKTKATKVKAAPSMEAIKARAEAKTTEAAE
jgi:predicted transcriptional regulator